MSAHMETVVLRWVELGCVGCFDHDEVDVERRGDEPALITDCTTHGC